ncbi:MAG: hypothetical protein E3J72_10695 [Planctomycetota bacterium]|nr:MAG: hypothetical protein E3J72_10695 [Planctomycetota bacterium]
MLNAVILRNYQSKFRLQNPWVVFGAGTFIAICGVLFIAVYALRDRLGTVDPLALNPLDPALRVYFGVLISLTYFFLLVYGTLCVAESVAGLKEDNAFDFERIAPRSPWSFALGNVLGAPLYAYFLTILGLVFAAFTVIFTSSETVSWHDFANHIIVLAGGVFFLHGFALLASVVLEKRLGAFLITLIIIGVYFGIGFFAFAPSPLSNLAAFSPSSFAMSFFPLKSAAAAGWAPTFFGLGSKSPYLLYLLSFIIQVFLGLGFIAIAARKFQRPDDVPVTKLEVLIALACVSLLVIALSWQRTLGAASSSTSWWANPEKRTAFFSLIELVLLINLAGWILFCFATAPTFMDYKRYYDPLRKSKRGLLHYLFGTGASILPTAFLNGLMVAVILVFAFLIPSGYLTDIGRNIEARRIGYDLLAAWGLTTLIAIFYAALTGSLSLAGERSGKVYALAIFCVFFIVPFLFVNFTGIVNRAVFFVLNPFTAVLPALPDAGVSIRGIVTTCCGAKVAASISVGRVFYLLAALIFYCVSAALLSVILLILQSRLRRRFTEEAL